MPLQRHETAIDDHEPAPVAAAEVAVGRRGRLTQSDYDLGSRKKIASSSASLLSEPVDRTQSPMMSAPHPGPPRQVSPPHPQPPATLSSRPVPSRSATEHGSMADVHRTDSRAAPPPMSRSNTVSSAATPPPPKHGSSHPHHHHSHHSPPGVTPDEDPSISAAAAAATAMASAAATAYDPYDGLPPPEESMLEIDEEEGVDDDGGEVRLLGSQEALDYDDSGRGILHHTAPATHGRHPHQDSRPTDL